MRFELERMPNDKFITVHTDADLRILFPNGYGWITGRGKDESTLKLVSRLAEIDGVEKVSTIERYGITFEIGKLANVARIEEEVSFLVQAWIGKPSEPVTAASVDEVVASAE